ncbi:hypothetical protein SLS60_003970 [Paraconiothyrium brasiliense]|uniref:Uncharacterized protein n=1 Tax=Paraconiothyrium brasiliense TaxID=300254 RepID=A0ABR3RQ61_9PLEO
MLISYLFGTYSTTFGTQSTGFIPTVPIKPGANVFSEDHAWVGPGKESDILWAELYQITSDDKFIQIGDPESYGIPPGQQDINGVNFYSISAMFRALVYDDSLSQNDGDHKRGLVHGLSQNKTWEDWYHIGHCFNYVRLAIRCTVDTTLEWPPGKIKPKKDMATSKGNRQCRDISFLDDFVEENKWINPTD